MGLYVYLYKHWSKPCLKQKITDLSFYFIGILKKAPDKRGLLECLVSIEDKWQEIGLALDVSSRVLNGAKNEQSNTIKLSVVIESWITTTTSSPITWETIISAVEGPIVNNKKKAKEIVDYLIKCKCVYIYESNLLTKFYIYTFCDFRCFIFKHLI